MKKIMFALIAILAISCHDESIDERAPKTLTIQQFKRQTDSINNLKMIDSMKEVRNKERMKIKNSQMDEIRSSSVLYTMEKYKQLKTNMKYSEAVKILGEEGNELSSNELGGIKTQELSWQNHDGSNLILMFQNERLTLKSQCGLR